MTPERDQQVMDLFLAVVELPGDRREAYLDAVADGDRELRSEVVRLLQYHSPQTLFPSHDGETMRRTDDKLSSSWKDRPNYLRRASSKTARGPRLLLVTSIGLAACLAALWYAVHASITQQLRGSVASQVQTVLDADVKAIEMWLAKLEQTANSWATQPRVNETLTELARLSRDQQLTTSELERTTAHANFLETVSPLLAQPEVAFVGAFARDGHGIAKCPLPRVTDVYCSSKGSAILSRCWRGETVFIPTFRTGENVVGAPKGFMRPSVSFVAPVRDEEDRIVAAMQLILQIDDQFATLFSVAQLGETGETYAFDERGTLLTDLRAEERLQRIGLIPEGERAALNLVLRDPGVDLRIDQAQAVTSNLPLTVVPGKVIAGQGKIVDVTGYRNYAGVEVVGAARWLANYGFGVVTELEYGEAYAPLQSVTWIFAAVFGLFASAAGLALMALLRNRILREQADEARKLGQYTLGELIGEGGMAKVYAASHALLRRTAAVKLIRPDPVDKETIASFEREVQLTAELTHPNTIQIYDFGHSDEGVFYFVMEYVRGVTLAELVARDGPLPAARVVYLLRQVCGSLGEAHRKGLVHRDIKPANIMVCERGGQYDFVKVLDFGLVIHRSSGDVGRGGRKEISGTPPYIAPERIRGPSTLDPRSDIYSVGAVGYYLLTGVQIFDGHSPIDLLHQMMNEAPKRTSELAPRNAPAKLDELLNDCLAKDPSDRPANMTVVMEVLDSLMITIPWTQVDAKAAWPNVEARGETTSRNLEKVKM